MEKEKINMNQEQIDELLGKNTKKSEESFRNNAKLPLWIKGGIIGLIIGIVLLLIAIAIEQNTRSELMSKIISYIPLNLWEKYISTGGTADYGFILWVPILYLIQSFILGALIGFIIQKIKERNHSQNL